jgi:hypothetical protein
MDGQLYINTIFLFCSIHHEKLSLESGNSPLCSRYHSSDKMKGKCETNLLGLRKE